MPFFFIFLVLLATVAGRTDRATVTYFTALYDINMKRSTQWSRDFKFYLDNFKELLQVEGNLVVFGQEETI